MPSVAYGRWITTRRTQLDEIRQAHAAIGGMGRGRRYATQQLNQAYVVLLASHFQGYCRDLHTESVDFLVPKVPLPHFQASIRKLLTQNLQLKRSNANPGSIGDDFGRFGIDFWTEVKIKDPRNEARQTQLDELNRRRNEIAHQDFKSNAALHLRHVLAWRVVCQHLARSFDEVMRHHLQYLTGAPPW